MESSLTWVRFGQTEKEVFERLGPAIVGRLRAEVGKVPWIIFRPRTSSKTDVQRSSTSERRCELIMTAAPRSPARGSTPASSGSPRVEPGQRLVEHDHRRVVEVAAADGHLLPHPPRQVRAGLVALLGELELARIDSADPVQSRSR